MTMQRLRKMLEMLIVVGGAMIVAVALVLTNQTSDTTWHAANFPQSSDNQLIGRLANSTIKLNYTNRYNPKLGINMRQKGLYVTEHGDQLNHTFDNVVTANKKWHHAPHVQSSDQSVVQGVQNNNCSTKYRVYYMRVHKTGSTTITTILFRFGLRHNLTFAMFKDLHPFPRKHMLSDLQPIPGRGKSHSNIPQKRDIMNFHSVFDQKEIYKFMHNDTLFISSLRHPLDHLKSAFNHYELAKRLHMSQFSNPVETFLSDPQKYDRLLPTSLYKPVRDGQAQISFTKNRMSFEMGFDLSQAKSNNSYVAEYLKYLDTVFTHVIIAEYYIESLLILRRKLCWKYTDILYLSKNQKRYTAKQKTPEEYGQLYANHRQWASVDYAMYEQFLHKHQVEAAALGPSLQKEAQYFTELLQSIRPFCFDICMEVRSAPFQAKIRQRDFTRLYDIIHSKFPIGQSQFHEQFDVSGEDCMGLFASQGFYHQNIRLHYMKPKTEKMYMYGHFPATTLFKQCKRTPGMTQDEFERMCCNEFY